MRPFLLLVLIVTGSSATVARPVPAAQPAPPDTLVVELGTIVVTATRTARQLEDVSMPTTVVSAVEMRRQGAVRLREVLAAVPGLALFDDHGTGLQVQGFSPEYTLILIDGQPVIGRTAGTLDVGRLTVHGLDRVEIVRGPSSSLYGSEALAGVVNLITATPAEGLRGALGLRAGSFGTTDLNAEAEAGAGQTAARLLVNRYASAGYDLTPATFGATVPAFADWTADLRARSRISDRVQVRLGTRLALQEQHDGFARIGEGGSEVRFDAFGRRIEWSVHPQAEVRLSQRLRLSATAYGASFRTETRHNRQDDGALHHSDEFDHWHARAESQLDAFWTAQHMTSLGAGGAEERLIGDRYAFLEGLERPVARQVWGFVQHEWLPSRRLELSASARFDAHADYAPRLSPKLGVLVRPSEVLRLRASIGSGFKAPAFRQLYLTWNNAVVGYSVFGTARLREGIARLRADGQIDQVFLDPERLEPIRAESSVALNVGGTYEPFLWLRLSVNGFYNDVRDLIEAQPIALKTNGRFVFTFFNIARIYTRGVEAEVAVRPLERPADRLDVSFGYQFLRARDRAILEALASGTVFGRDPDGREYRLRVGDYGGLFGRSPHALSVRATYTNEPHGLSASLRARWRSRYGYRDLDGNGIANRPDEFVPAYGVLDATITRAVRLPGPADAEVQLGVDNALGITRPAMIPSLPGRRLYAGVRFSF